MNSKTLLAFFLVLIIQVISSCTQGKIGVGDCDSCDNFTQTSCSNNPDFCYWCSADQSCITLEKGLYICTPPAPYCLDTCICPPGLVSDSTTNGCVCPNLNHIDPHGFVSPPSMLAQKKGSNIQIQLNLPQTIPSRYNYQAQWIKFTTRTPISPPVMIPLTDNGCAVTGSFSHTLSWMYYNLKPEIQITDSYYKLVFGILMSWDETVIPQNTQAERAVRYQTQPFPIEVLVQRTITVDSSITSDLPNTKWALTGKVDLKLNGSYPSFEIDFVSVLGLPGYEIDPNSMQVASYTGDYIEDATDPTYTGTNGTEGEQEWQFLIYFNDNLCIPSVNDQLFITFDIVTVNDLSNRQTYNLNISLFDIADYCGYNFSSNLSATQTTYLDDKFNQPISKFYIGFPVYTKVNVTQEDNLPILATQLLKVTLSGPGVGGQTIVIYQFSSPLNEPEYQFSIISNEDCDEAYQSCFEFTLPATVIPEQTITIKSDVNISLNLQPTTKRDSTPFIRYSSLTSESSLFSSDQKSTNTLGIAVIATVGAVALIAITALFAGIVYMLKYKKRVDYVPIEK